jgi:hypothetical protein
LKGFPNNTKSFGQCRETYQKQFPILPNFVLGYFGEIPDENFPKMFEKFWAVWGFLCCLIISGIFFLKVERKFSSAQKIWSGTNHDAQKIPENFF